MHGPSDTDALAIDIFGTTMTWVKDRFDCTNMYVVYFWFKYYLDRSTTCNIQNQKSKHPKKKLHHKFNPTVVRTHDFQILDSTFHVPEMLAVTTEYQGLFAVIISQKRVSPDE